jgi:hypothetical protein
MHHGSALPAAGDLLTGGATAMPRADASPAEPPSAIDLHPPTGFSVLKTPHPRQSEKCARSGIIGQFAESPLRRRSSPRSSTEVPMRIRHYCETATAGRFSLIYQSGGART